MVIQYFKHATYSWCWEHKDAKMVCRWLLSFFPLLALHTHILSRQQHSCYKSPYYPYLFERCSLFPILSSRRRSLLWKVACRRSPPHSQLKGQTLLTSWQNSVRKEEKELDLSTSSSHLEKHCTCCGARRSQDIRKTKCWSSVYLTGCPQASKVSEGAARDI